MVCKYWYKNIIKDIKKKKLEFYDTQLYYAINNKHMYLSYSKFDKILLSAYDNIILNIIKNVINDEDIKDNFMNKMIENYKQLSIIIAIFYNYNTNTNTSTNITNRNDDDKFDNIEKYIAEDYSKLLSQYYNYNIILA
jgi:hypothetical protein